MLVGAVCTPVISYTVAQSFLTEKQMDDIDRATISRLYAMSGYNWHMSRAVLNAPKDMGGAGFIPLKVHAYTGYADHVLKHWQTPHEEVGKVLRVVYAWMVKHVGVTTLLLKCPSMSLPHIRSKVIPEVQDALVRMNTTFHVDKLYIRPKLRVNDILIMDLVLQRERKSIVVKKINAVQEWIGAFYMSEIVQLDRERLQCNILNFELPTEYTVTRRRVKQSAPDKTCWRLFLEALTDVCDQHKYLHEPMGEWTIDHSKSGIWKFYFNDGKVYERGESLDGTLLGTQRSD